MSRKLTPGSTLENLKKEAKRWLHALRANDHESRDRLERALPEAPAEPGLRDVQLALAREHGLPGWAALKEAVATALADAELVTKSHAELVARFLAHAAPDWRMGGGPLQVRHRHTAERILQRHPEIARANIFTRVVCGDPEGVQQILAEQPGAAVEKGGPKKWPPLLYLCAGRLSLPAFRDNSIAIARALLDRGADPNAYFPGGNPRIHYTALTCVIGQGEERAPLHPQGQALAALLLERGAEPYDNQVFYNISQGYLDDGAVWLLELIHEHSVRLGRQADWADPEWSMIDMGGYGLGARFVLEHAVEGNHLTLARWALEHGASPNATQARDPRWSRITLYEEARRRGLTEMADLLVRHGATVSVHEMKGEEAFAAACFRLDRDAALTMLGAHPEYLRSPLAMHTAARQDRDDVVAFLLNLGASPDVEDPRQGNQRPLHVAAYADAPRVVTLLIARGAKIDSVDSMHEGTPLWFAMWGRKPRTIELLSPHSRDLWALNATGNVERVREVLTADPEAARWVGGESTPLMWLPDDEARAIEIVELLLARGADAKIRRKDGKTAADIARERGMDAAAALLDAGGGPRLTSRGERPAGTEPYDIDRASNTIRPRHILTEDEWDTVIDAMRETRITGLIAHGQMTDGVLERISRLDHVTRLDLNGSKQLTDDGLRHLARMPQLQDLDLSGGDMQITDRGLEVLRQLRELQRFQMCWPNRVTDAGVANLTFCDHLEKVNLMGTPTGDGAINALTGKRRLRHFSTGRLTTDAGLGLLQRFPVFKDWQGGEIKYDLMSFDAEPNALLLDGPFTDAGLRNLEGLDGLFGLNLFWHVSAMTAAGLAPLTGLPKLGFLGCHGPLATDDAMPHIAALPHLRMLMAQGTVASDDGFAALSRSQTIEYIWGRECPNLHGRGFAAMAAMPALRGLAVSCKGVDDASLSALSRFPALDALMPMDVSDEGFRHVGRCERLEHLWCMYCRDTGDVATGHIAGLSRLKTYYAGKTRITDRSLEILGRMSSLERLEFWAVGGITDAGLAHLAGLPRLREITLESPNITREGAAVFPPGVRVNYST